MLKFMEMVAVPGRPWNSSSCFKLHLGKERDKNCRFLAWRNPEVVVMWLVAEWLEHEAAPQRLAPAL
jgi:hypothetical protein